MNNIYIGIDNGLDGACVAISATTGGIIEAIIMPTKAKKKGREVDAEALWLWLGAFGGSRGDDLTAVLETPGKQGVRFKGRDGQMKQGGSLALCSMWDSYGAIRSIFETRRIRHHRIPPQTWQAVMLGKVEKGMTKPAALSKARQLWPDENWLKTPRCTTPHDGMIDAALIGEYARIKRL